MLGIAESGEFSICDQDAIRLRLIDLDRGIRRRVHPNPQEIAVHGARLALDKMIPNGVGKGKCVEDVLPIGAAKDKRPPELGLPPDQRLGRGEPRVEVNVLDAANVA